MRIRTKSGNGKNGQQELKANSKLTKTLLNILAKSCGVFHLSFQPERCQHLYLDWPAAKCWKVATCQNVNLQLQGTHFVHANNPARFSFSPKRWSNVCINCSRTSKKARVRFDSLTKKNSLIVVTALNPNKVWRCSTRSVPRPQWHNCLTGKSLHQIVCKIQAIYKPWLCCSVGMPKRLALALPILRYSWVRRDKALAIH